MKLNIAIAGALAFGLALPAAAQMTTTTSSYYLVQDVKTKKCVIVDKEPDVAEYKTLGADGVVYKTRVEAEDVMKTTKVCTTE
jgi:hypothetical protein